MNDYKALQLLSMYPEMPQLRAEQERMVRFAYGARVHGKPLYRLEDNQLHGFARGVYEQALQVRDGNRVPISKAVRSSERIAEYEQCVARRDIEKFIELYADDAPEDLGCSVDDYVSGAFANENFHRGRLQD